MHIEVLICTHNRSVLLETVLNSLNQVIQPESCHVTLRIAANACNDETHSILTNYQEKQKNNNFLPLLWHDIPQAGKSNALNYVIPFLTGDLIAMIDDDHRISENYFNTLNNAYDTYHDTDIFFGKILPDWNEKEPKWAHEKGKYAIYPLPVPCYDKGDNTFEYHSKIPKPGGGNLALKREVFNLVGKFNTELGPSGHNLGGGEDSDFVQRAINKGIKLRYLPGMIQYHYVDLERFRLSYILTKSYQRSRSVTLIEKHNVSGIPKYMWKKLFIYLFFSVFSLNLDKTRFYLVRIAASLGEMSAYRTLLKK